MMGSEAFTVASTVVLVGLTLVILALAIRRLRRETRLSLRTALIGAIVPLASTLAYVVFGGMAAQLALVLVALLIGGLVGIGVARQSRIESRPTGIVIHQSGLTLVIWTIAYATTSLAGLAANASLRQLTVAALALTAGMAAGSQLGLFLRSRSAQPSAPAAWAPAPSLLAAAPAAVAWSGSLNATAPAPPAAPAFADPVPTAGVAQASHDGTLPAGIPAAPAAPEFPGLVHFTHAGTRFLFGYTSSFSAIWDRNAPGQPVAQYPRTVEGRAAAWSQFGAWEPAAAPVAPYAGLATAPIADEPVRFTHLGTRFAIGQTAERYAIWDRWSPGPPVAAFGTDPQGAQQAWRTFSAWEPKAVPL